MTIATLIAIATALQPTAGAAITTVEGLIGAIEKVQADLTTVPKNADGSDVTLEQAAAHLAASEDAGAKQDQSIRDKAAEYKAENSKEGGGTTGP